MTARSLSLLLALLAGACSGSRDERLSCADAPCPSGMRCDRDGSCVSTRVDIASAQGAAEGAPVEVSVLATDGRACEDARCSDLPIGTRVTFRAPEARGYRFIGWSGSAECRGEQPELVIASLARETECIARYVKRLRVSALDSSGQDGVRASSTDPEALCEATSCEIDKGGSVDLTAEPQGSVRFARWSGGAGCIGSDNPLSVTPKDEDVECTAEYVGRLSVTGRAEGAETIVKVSATGSAPVCEPGSCVVDQGDSVQLEAEPIEGYRFAGWRGTSACGGQDGRLTLPALAASEACVGDYVARRKVSGRGEGPLVAPAVRALSEESFASCSEGTCEVDVGGSVTLSAPTAEGYRLRAWSGPGCEGQERAAVTLRDVREELACTAHYVAGIAVAGALLGAEGEVAASSPSGSARCAAGRCVVDAGASATLTAPALPDHRFVGWEGDPGCSGQTLAITFSQVTTSRTCYARYAPRFRVAGAAMPTLAGRVVATSSGTTTARCEAGSCTVDAGASVTLSASPSEGFRFAGWTGGGACAGQASSIEIPRVVSHVTCAASFVGRVSVVGMANPTTSGSVRASSTSSTATCQAESCTVDPGALVTLVASPAAGQRFAGWSGCSTATTPTVTLEGVTANTACSAHFEVQRFVVTGAVAPLRSGEVRVSSLAPDARCAAQRCEVSLGAHVTVTAAPAPGFSFAGWRGCSESREASLTLANVAASATCTASFTAVTLQVSARVTPQAAGSVLATSEASGATCVGGQCTNLPFGSPVQVRASPSAGFAFVGWSECSSAAAPVITLPSIMASATCLARFERQRVVVTAVANPGAGGQVVASSPAADAACSGASCTVSPGTAVSLRATPAAGFDFAGWMGCSEVATNPLTLPDVRANIGCTANFRPLPSLFTVEARVLPAGGGTVSGVVERSGGPEDCGNLPCRVLAGGTVRFAAQPASGFRFTGFTGCVSTTENPMALTNVQASAVCTANFEPAMFTLAVEAAAGRGTARIVTPLPACETPLACSKSVAAGTSVTIDATPAAGFSFDGWRGCAGAGSEPRVTLVVGESMTCTATFAASITVTADAFYPYDDENIVLSADAATIVVTADSPEASCTGPSCTTAAGDSVTLTATPGAGSPYRFVSWSCEGFTTLTRPTANSVRLPRLLRSTACRARFNASFWTVRVLAAAGGTASITSDSPWALCRNMSCRVLSGSEATIRAMPNQGQVFNGWGCNPEAPNPHVLTNIQSQLGCQALFTEPLH